MQAGLGYAIIEEGVFQVVIGEFAVAAVMTFTGCTATMDGAINVSYIPTRRCLMRSTPDSNNEQPVADAADTLPVASPAFTPKTPIPAPLAALGREVLGMVPRKQRGSLEAYRQAANDLSAILKVTGVRMTPKNLYYAALRVKWIVDNTTA